MTAGWPYVNYMPHLGTLVGSLLSADVFARYLRLRGHDVLFVTGSDEHGTPVEVEAINEGISPEELASANHERVVKVLEGFGISTDNYTRTHNPIHMKFVQEFYRKVYDNGHIAEKPEEQFYCKNDQIFLPDRFVKGTCPVCGYEDAEGDQCPSCGHLLTPTELREPTCSVCGITPRMTSTTQWYFDLPSFEEFLKRLLQQSETITENAKSSSLQMIKAGLRARSVTRDNKWGIPAPFPEAEGKTIYVWMENMLGYVSAVVEYFKDRGKEESWKTYWQDPETNIIFFIGKDNIPFHAVIFPALLQATGDPYTFLHHIAATEFLMWRGQPFSKSKRVGIWLDEALRSLPADYWRFSLILIRPEVKDTSFSWEHLEKAVNEELNDQLGNLVQRILVLLNDHFDGEVPAPKEPTRMQISLTNDVTATRDTVEDYMKSYRLQRALVSIMELVRKCNSLLNLEEPWHKVKTNKQEAGNTLTAVIYTLRAVSVMLYPFLPLSAEKLLSYLGIEPREIRWSQIGTSVPAKHSVAGKHPPLFFKVDIKDIEKKLEKHREFREKAENLVSFEDFSKLDLRVAKILHAERVRGAKKLLRLDIDMGGETRTTVAGLASQYAPSQLVGKEVVVICNLEPRQIYGVTSEVMLLAASSKDGEVAILTPDKTVEIGSKVH
ncbi:MAG: methionine--tRNA ligase [Candidatus Geothermarchaeales archaeon]